MSRKTATARAGQDRTSLYDEITGKIIAELEAVGIAVRRALGAALSWDDIDFDVIHGPVVDPMINVAMDETLVEDVAAGRRKPFMRLWEWNGPQVVIGSFQSYQNEIQQDGVDRYGITVSRRVTGGGAMFMEPGNCIFTNVALTDDGDVWWEDMSEPPAHLTDWHGNDWTPASDVTAAHPNSRYTVPITQCPVTAAEFNDPKGVPVSAMLFGGRRPDTVPLVSEAYSWNHGVYIGATLSSGQTAAAEGKVGSIRRDPMAMIPFIGYNVGDYLQHWIDMGEKGGDKMPKIFYVNWFRKNDDGKFLWPGFGDNSRVLKWIVDRLEGRVEADNTIVGQTARVEDLDLTGLEGYTEDDVKAALAVHKADWERELPDLDAWFKKLGPKVPQEVLDEYEALKQRIADAKN